MSSTRSCVYLYLILLLASTDFSSFSAACCTWNPNSSSGPTVRQAVPVGVRYDRACLSGVVPTVAVGVFCAVLDAVMVCVAIEGVGEKALKAVGQAVAIHVIGGG